MKHLWKGIAIVGMWVATAYVVNHGDTGAIFIVTGVATIFIGIFGSVFED